jgi:uncharacterized membrane protein YhaH (DUF805 family)
MTRMPFWLHQALEYAIGLGLIFQATQGGSMAPAALAGAVVLIVAATVEGPLAAWHAVSRRTHRLVDVGVALTMAAMAVIPGTGIDGLARAALGVAAVLLGILVLTTDYSPRRPRRPLPDSEELGRAAGRFVGRRIQAHRRKPSR